MSATTITMTVSEARRRLSNTAGMSAEQVSDLQQVVDAFYTGKPPRGKQCVACSAAVWEERTTKAGDAIWCCAGCGRPGSLSSDEWSAQRAAASAVRRVQDKAAADAAPKPRAVLQEALGRLAETRAALSHIEAALPAARSTMVTAQLKHDRAEEAAEAAAEQAAAHLADSIQGRRMAGPAPSIAATRAALASAVDGLVAAKNARTILDSRLDDARAAMRHAADRAKKAAVRVLASETLEDLIETASVARAAYIDAVAALSWLIRQGGVPNGDARAHQLIIEADTAPSTWREAQSADGGMAARLNALLA